MLPAHVLLAQLTPAERALLRRPLWLTGVDGSFKVGGHAFIQGELRGPLAIIGGAADDPTVLFDQARAATDGTLASHPSNGSSAEA